MLCTKIRRLRSPAHQTLSNPQMPRWKQESALLRRNMLSINTGAENSRELYLRRETRLWNQILNRTLCTLAHRLEHGIDPRKVAANLSLPECEMERYSTDPAALPRTLSADATTVSSDTITSATRYAEFTRPKWAFPSWAAEGTNELGDGLRHVLDKPFPGWKEFGIRPSRVSIAP